MFSVAAPTQDAAVLLVEQEHARELAELLDFPPLRTVGRGVSTDEADVNGLERFLVAVDVTLEADTGADATAELQRTVAEMLVGRSDVRGVLQASAVSDPRLRNAATKRALAHARDWLTDHLRIDAEDRRRGAEFAELMIVPEVLPRCFDRYYTAELIERWSETVEIVAAKLSAYPDTYLASTAEELAAHALIQEARAMLEDDEELSSEDVDIADAELEELLDVAFEDHDVLMLFDARLDGVESSDLVAQMGLANLHVRDWFKPFR
jgi:hypothetical protein